MNVLFAASEGTPFVKTGGLGDVIGALPRALQALGNNVAVILPKYENISHEYKEQMTLIERIEVPVGWRNKYCGIETLMHNGIRFYFLDNEYYFKRNGSYGFYDDGERFAFFSRAVLEALPYLEEKPNILHCHDWQTGPISVLLRAHYKNHPFYRDIKTVFTIHNLHYQGEYPKQVLSELLDLSELYFHMDGLEYRGNVSYLKAGLAYADYLTTVSPTYASEIQMAYYGEGLDGFLRKRNQEFQGIVNGIDPEAYNPLKDEHIFKTYDHYEDKIQNKIALQAMLKLPVDHEIPMIGMVTRLVDQKGIDLVLHVIQEILNLRVQVVVLGTGEGRLEHALSELAHDHADQVSVHLCFNEELARKMYAASDMLLMPSKFEPCGIGQLLALKYGSLPIVRETGGLYDTVIPYNEFNDEGYGFSFTNVNAHDMLYTIERAVWLYRFQPNKWRDLVERAMQLDFSWEASSENYNKLYEMLIEEKEDVLVGN